MSLLFQGFEGTLVWENMASAGLTTVNSSVQLNDGGGVLKISSVRSNRKLLINVLRIFPQVLMSQIHSFCFVAFLLNCRLQRAYCLIEVHLGFPDWLEASHLPSMVGPATGFKLELLMKTM